MMETQRTFTAFAGMQLIGAGSVGDVARAAKAYLDDACGAETVLVFDDETGAQVELELQGTLEEVLERIESDPELAPPRNKVGRPRLGVISREVSLLPRHWEWLSQQPGGVSGALRKLVEEASRQGRESEQTRRARDAAAKFMWGMAGNLPGFEEATRALYADDYAGVRSRIQCWPSDIRAYVERMLEKAESLQRALGQQDAGQ